MTLINRGQLAIPINSTVKVLEIFFAAEQLSSFHFIDRGSGGGR